MLILFMYLAYRSIASILFSQWKISSLNSNFWRRFKNRHYGNLIILFSDICCFQVSYLFETYNLLDLIEDPIHFHHIQFHPANLTNYSLRYRLNILFSYYWTIATKQNILFSWTVIFLILHLLALLTLGNSWFEYE